MINKNRINGCREYTCDDEECNAVANFKNYDVARKSGWSVAYWRDKFYCPECAPKYKNVGCKGKKPQPSEKQLKIAE